MSHLKLIRLIIIVQNQCFKQTVSLDSRLHQAFNNNSDAPDNFSGNLIIFK